jgi:CheY-like chemotaxis protein
MRPAGRILIVDDDSMFLDMYRELLSRDGYTVESAMNRTQAIERLDEKDWDVVILDLRLLGLDGPDQGIELIGEVSRRAPGAKAIIITAYTTSDAIERAYAAGAVDFLEKQSKFFEHHLRAKVRNAVDAVRERNFGRLDRGEAEERIQSIWQALQSEPDANRKGLLLEELIELLFRSIDGFHTIERRRRSEDEEIDLVIQTDPKHASFWARESTYILVECKNWSRPVGPEPFDRFQNKLQRRFGRAKLGFFVATGGFAAGFHSTRQTERKGDVLVVCIGPEDLATLVAAGDRDAVLKQFHARAIIDANGSH